MSHYIRLIASVVVGCALLASSLAASGTQQAAAQTPPAPVARPEILLKVDVVLSRFQGDKKTSSLPFTLWINTGATSPTGFASLRVGVDVPIGTTASARTVPDNRNTSNNTATTTTTTNNTDYRNVGTSIDCRTTPLSDGRFMLNVGVQDSSIFSDATGRGAIKPGGPMAFRTFQMSNTLPLRDGQTLQFATATDKITGEVLKVDVTLSTIK